jgi:ribosome-binding factor A
MNTRRTVRVASALQRELARLIARERAFENALLTITYVEVSADLRHALVYISSLDPNFIEAPALESLRAAAPRWFKEIGRRLELKYIPKLEFRFDTAQERGDRVLGMLRQLEDETCLNPDDNPADPHNAHDDP